MVSIRQKRIIEYLCQASEYVSMKELAEKLKLTERTVYRELPDINKIFSKYNVMLTTVFNKGIKIKAMPRDLTRLRSFLNGSVLHEIYPVSTREDMIMLRLLDEKFYTKAQILAIDTKSSLKTVRNDLTRLKKAAPKYQIKIESKKGSGFFIKADEVLKRHLLVRIILNNLKVEDFFKYLADEYAASVTAKFIFCELKYESYFKRIYRLLRSAVASCNVQITDRNFQEAIVMLAVLLRRNNLLSGKYSFTNDLMMYYDEQLFLNDLKKALEKEFSCVLGKKETEYFLWITSLYVKLDCSGKTEYDKALLNNVSELIGRAECELHQKLRSPALEKNLYNHLSMALNRIKKGIWTSNPYRDDIKKNYKNIYEMTRKICGSVFSGKNISDDEIAYIVLYFAAAVSDAGSRIFKALVICTSGMGTSKLLVSRLKKEFPNILVEKTLPLIKLPEEALDKYDIIISTAPLQAGLNKAVTVSPLLTDREVKALRQILEK